MRHRGTTVRQIPEGEVRVGLVVAAAATGESYLPAVIGDALEPSQSDREGWNRERIPRIPERVLVVGVEGAVEYRVEQPAAKLGDPLAALRGARLTLPLAPRS